MYFCLLFFSNSLIFSATILLASSIYSSIILWVSFLILLYTPIGFLLSSNLNFTSLVLKLNAPDLKRLDLIILDIEFNVFKSFEKELLSLSIAS